MIKKTGLILISFILVLITTAAVEASCINVTDDLYVNENRTLCLGTYNISDNASNGLIIINASNIVLDCNNSVIIGNSSGYGIYIDNFDNVTVENCNIYNYSRGFYLDSADNNILKSNTAMNNSEDGFYLGKQCEDNRLINNTANFNQGSGFRLEQSTTINNIMTNNIILNNTYAIYFAASSKYNILINSILNNSITADVKSGGSTADNTLLNTTFTTTSISAGLIRVKWYLDVYVNDTVGNNVSSANVSGYNNTDDLVFSVLTQADGYIPKQNLTEYTQNSSDKNFKTNYTLITNKTGYPINSKSVNLTKSTLIVITLDNIGPEIKNETRTPAIVYNNYSATLNATITDFSGISNVWISGNWNGSWANYTVTNKSNNVYSYTVSAGNFSNNQTVQWKYYGNDSLGNLANGSLQSFTISNRPPQFQNISPVNWSEDTIDTSLNLTKYFTDPDNDNLTFSSTTPVNITVSINQTTGIVNLTPKANFTGVEYITFTATDPYGASNISNQVMLNVTPVNDPPIITSTPNLTAIEAIEYSYDVNATDIDSNISQLIYAVEKPSNAAIDNSNGLLKWIPTAAQVGVNEFIINATDPEGNYTKQSFNVTVIPVLDITDMKVNSVSVTDNDTIENIKPGDTITVNYKIKNRFSDGIKGDLVGITSTRRIDDLSYYSTTSAFNLDAQETKELNYTFSVPYIIGIDSFKLNLSAAGQDLNITPNYYSSEKNINFNINKSLHNITITNKEFSNSNLTCDRKTELMINVANTGQAEENVTVIVTNTDINKSKNFKLASNTTTVLNYSIDTTSSAIGKKTFTITVSYQFGYYSFTETIDLLVNDCLDTTTLNNILKVNEDTSPGWSPLDLTDYTFGNTTGLIYGIVSQNFSLINCSIINNNLSCSTPSANSSGISTINMSINASSSIYLILYSMKIHTMTALI